MHEAITCVGAITAQYMLAELSKLGQLNRAQAVAFGRLTSHARQCSCGNGRRTISAGRASVRRALYMAVLVVARANRTLRAVHWRLGAAGIPPKAALTAEMRKLVVQINQVLKNPNFQLAN